MKFIINTNKFIECVTLAADIALKNTLRHHQSEGLVNLTAYPKCLIVRAYGGSASISIEVHEPDEYDYFGSGDVCIQAKELVLALKSFPSSDDLEVRIKNGKLRLSTVSDRHNNVNIPLIYPVPEHPNHTEEYDQEVTVDREYFLKGLQQVRYASATDERLFSYMCILFETTCNTLKFSAGNGGRFAVIEYIGSSDVISNGDARIIFPKNNIPNIVRILKKETSKDVDIRSVPVNKEENVPEQIILETNSLTIRIYGNENFMNYPDLNKVIDYEYTYQLATKVAVWKYVGEAISGSTHSLQESVHNSKIVADMQHRHFDLQTNTHMQLNRRIPFELDTSVTSDTKEKSCKPWFCCSADYLIELPKKNKKKKVVVFNFEDQAELEGLSEKENFEKRKPILLRFPDEVDKNGVMEKSVVFFSISTRWDDSYWFDEHEEIESKFDILDL